MTINTDSFNYSHLPYDICVFIRDLKNRDLESASASFPDISNLEAMTVTEKDSLVEYLRGIDEDEYAAFAERCADLLEQLRSEEEQAGYEEAK